MENSSSSPLVSVCLITYNHEEYITQAIESVLMQKLDCDWEFIIADDCSSDKTSQIVENYANANPNLIRKLDNSTNLGAGKNFVRLLDAAKGKYIAYLEGDDYWTDIEKLQRQFNYMQENKRISLCYHKVDWVFTMPYVHNVEESNTDDNEFYTFQDLFQRGWFIRSCSMFFKNIDLPKKFDKLYIGDFTLHVLLANIGDIGFINKRMATYRINHNGASETKLSNLSSKQELQKSINHIKMLAFLVKNVRFKYRKIVLFKMAINTKGTINLLGKITLKKCLKLLNFSKKNPYSVE